MRYGTEIRRDGETDGVWVYLSGQSPSDRGVKRDAAEGCTFMTDQQFSVFKNYVASFILPAPTVEKSPVPVEVVLLRDPVNGRFMKKEV